MKKANQNSELVEIEKERQKTKRYILFISSFVLLAGIGLFFVFKNNSSGESKVVDLDILNGKLSFSVNASGNKNENSKSSSTIYSERLNQITSGNITIIPDHFEGNYFINQENKFILTAQHPDLWKIQYNPAAIDNFMIPINGFYIGDDWKLDIYIQQVDPKISVKAYIENILKTIPQADGPMSPIPSVSYTDTLKSGNLYLSNKLTKTEIFSKIIIENGRCYTAEAKYSLSDSQASNTKELINLASSLTIYR